MRPLILTIAICFLAACGGNSAQLRERVGYWQGALVKGVPNGTSREKVLEWGVAHKVKFDYLEQQHWLYANVEQVKETGIPFPCSAWNIILKVTFDANGRSSNSEVSTVGSCI